MTTSKSVRWWDKPRAWGRQGSIVTVKGSDTVITCPKCKTPVVYNGNYFCDNWAYRPGPGECSWALRHPARSRRDREICDLIGIDYS